MTTVEFYVTSGAGRNFSLHGGLSGVASDATDLLRREIEASIVTPIEDPGASFSARAIPGQVLRRMLEPLRDSKLEDSPYVNDPPFKDGAELLAFIDPDDVYDVVAIDF